MERECRERTNDARRLLIGQIGDPRERKRRERERERERGICLSELVFNYR